MSATLTVLVLAGQREGGRDALAEYSGVEYKALAPVAGRPMIEHALGAIAACGRVGRIVVSINEGARLEALPEVARLTSAGRLRITPSRANLVDSVLDALDGASFPVLVTTADNVLLTPQAVAEIDERARLGGLDVGVAMARREDVLAAHPQGQLKFYRCADGEYSNCNSYWLRHAGALAPAEAFRSGGQFVKHPLRVVGAFGLSGVIELIRFRFGLSALGASFRRLSRHFGLEIGPLLLKDGAQAIDVDHERSLKVAEQVLASRRAGASAAAA